MISLNILILLCILVISLSCSYQSKLNIIEDKINAKDVPIFEFRNIIEESIILNQ